MLVSDHDSRATNSSDCMRSQDAFPDSSASVFASGKRLSRAKQFRMGSLAGSRVPAESRRRGDALPIPGSDRFRHIGMGKSCAWHTSCLPPDKSKTEFTQDPAASFPEVLTKSYPLAGTSIPAPDPFVVDSRLSQACLEGSVSCRWSSSTPHFNMSGLRMVKDDQALISKPRVGTRDRSL